MFKFLKSLLKSIKDKIISSQAFKKFEKKYPRFFIFLQKRLDRDTIFGLHLTIGILVALFFLYIFLGIVQDLIGNDPLIQSDLKIINIVQILRTSNFNQIILFITNLGNWHIIFLGIILSSIVLILLKKWQHLLTLLISTAVGELLIWVMKNLFKRPRPELLNVLTPENSFSFPSSHSFVAISFYGLITYFIFRTVKSKRLRILTAVSGTVLISMIGFSRIYLGAHFPSDVLAGYAAGLAWVIALITALDIRLKTKSSKEKPYIRKINIVAIAFLGFFIWAGYSFYYYQSNPFIEPKTSEENITTISKNEIPNKLFINYPRRSEDVSGGVLEPINIIIIGNRDTLDKTFTDAGWSLTDQISLTSLSKMVKAIMVGSVYPQAPGTPSFWNKIPNDFAYEKQVNYSVKKREHIHFWKTSFSVKETNQNIWLATVHFDKTIVLEKLFIPVHEIDPDIDKEREKVKNELEETKDIDFIGKFRLVNPTSGYNQVGSHFFTDGMTYYIFLK